MPVDPIKGPSPPTMDGPAPDGGAPPTPVATNTADAYSPGTQTPVPNTGLRARFLRAARFFRPPPRKEIAPPPVPAKTVVIDGVPHTQAEIDAVIRQMSRIKEGWGGEDEIRAGMAPMQDHMPELVDGGIFGPEQCTALFANMAIRTNAAWYTALILDKRFRFLLGRGLVTKAHITGLVRNIFDGHYDSYAAYLSMSRLHLNLPALAHAGLYDSSHLTEMVRGFAQGYYVRDHSDNNSGLLTFFQKHLGLLIENGIFTEAHFQTVIAGLKAKKLRQRLATLKLLKAQLPAMIEKGWFTETHLDAVTHVFAEEFEPAKYGGISGHQMYEAAQRVIEKNAEVLAKSGLLKKRHSRAYVDYVIADRPWDISQSPSAMRIFVESGLIDSGDIAYMLGRLRAGEHNFQSFVRRHIELFITSGLFTERDFKLIATRDERGAYTPEALSFFTSNLKILIDEGWFTYRHYRNVMSCLESPDERVCTAAIELLKTWFGYLKKRGWLENSQYHRYVSPLISHPAKQVRHRLGRFMAMASNFAELFVDGLLDERAVALLAYQDRSMFLQHFHLLRARGFVNRKLLVHVLKQAGLKKDIANILICLADEEWLGSPNRWSAFLCVLGRDTRRKTFDRVLEKIAGENRRIKMADMAGMISLIDSAEDWLAEKIAGDDKLFWIGAEVQTLRALNTTARLLSAKDDTRFTRALSILEYGAGRRILAEWHLDDIEKTWDGYLETRGKERQKARKRFLNFLDTGIKREPPTLCALILRRARQLSAQKFIDRLRKGAGFSESKRLSEFFVRHGDHFRSTGFYRLLVRASGFMNPDGMTAMRRLILSLSVQNGRFIAPARYDELEGVVSPAVLEIWKKEYSLVPKDLPPIDAEEGKKLVKEQAIFNIKEHLSSIASLPDGKIPHTIADIPIRIARWVMAFESSDETGGKFLEEAIELKRIFDSGYQEIRAVFGNIFANILTDLHNYVSGMEKGPKFAKMEERFVISGDAETLARAGNTPVETCQTMERKWMNENGEPINRIIHGQTKVANWIVDGAVLARRLIEITVDEEGKEHLLVERLYLAGGFVRDAVMRQEILAYAKSMGIGEDRVHFSGKADKYPPALNTGDRIYRDTFSGGGMTLSEARKLKKRLAGKPPPEDRPPPSAAETKQPVRRTHPAPVTYAHTMEAIPLLPAFAWGSEMSFGIMAGGATLALQPILFQVPVF